MSQDGYLRFTFGMYDIFSSAGVKHQAIIMSSPSNHSNDHQVSALISRGLRYWLMSTPARTGPSAVVTPRDVRRSRVTSTVAGQWSRRSPLSSQGRPENGERARRFPATPARRLKRGPRIGSALPRSGQLGGGGSGAGQRGRRQTSSVGSRPFPASQATQSGDNKTPTPGWMSSPRLAIRRRQGRDVNRRPSRPSTLTSAPLVPRIRTTPIQFHTRPVSARPCKFIDTETSGSRLR